jgi:hypothetical protein
LQRDLPSPLELENAIAAIEDRHRPLLLLLRELMRHLQIASLSLSPGR